MRRVLHLTRRFFVSLWPVGPSEVDDRWARSQLSPRELRLWGRMSRQDRGHATAVARQVDRELGEGSTETVRAAALLHDVGKTVANLGTYGRVIATLSAAVAGEDTARLWAGGQGLTRRVGLYLDYPELGVDLLELAGSDPLVIAWSREHHLPAAEWSIDPALGEILSRADDEA